MEAELVGLLFAHTCKQRKRLMTATAPARPLSCTDHAEIFCRNALALVANSHAAASSEQKFEGAKSANSNPIFQRLFS
jgi:hypothetical protein